MNEIELRLKARELEEKLRKVTYQVESLLTQLYQISVELAKMRELDKCLEP